MPAMISDKDRAYLRKTFEERLRKPVTLLLFTKSEECALCSETRGFIEELASMSDLLSVEVYDLARDADVAREHGIDKAPAIKLRGERDFGVRYFGIPDGYEFIAIVQDIIDVSWGTAELPVKALELVMAVDKPLHLQVFVSPTCPYCPAVVRAAHKFAILNELITADMVEISEFPDYAARYEVQGVPKIVANDRTSIVGALPEVAIAQFAAFAVDAKGASGPGGVSFGSPF